MPPLANRSNDPQGAAHDRSAPADLSADEQRVLEQIGSDAAPRQPTLDWKFVSGPCLPIIAF